MLVLDAVIILLGFIAITLSARQAMKSVIAISRHYRVPEFTISFLLVGIISILPELSIGVNSALNGTGNFGLGIVLGSNIADLTLVLGIVALASRGIRVEEFIIKQSAVFISFVAPPLVLLLDGELSRLDGILLVGVFAAYVAWMFLSRRTLSPSVRDKTN